MEYQITGSIVVFKNNRAILEKAVRSFLSSKLAIKLNIIDNSPTDSLNNISLDTRVKYIFNNKNLGFGKAHNIAMRLAMNEAPYHIIINPDVDFDGDILNIIWNYMNDNPDTSQLMPNILYPDGQIQYLCKLLPAPADLFLRRF